MAASAAETAPAPASARPRVAFIPVEGMIDEHRFHQFDRALNRALEAKPDFVVVHITTDGGLVSSAMDMAGHAGHTA